MEFIGAVLEWTGVVMMTASLLLAMFVGDPTEVLCSGLICAMSLGFCLCMGLVIRDE